MHIALPQFPLFLFGSWENESETRKCTWEISCTIVTYMNKGGRIRVRGMSSWLEIAIDSPFQLKMWVIERESLSFCLSLGPGFIPLTPSSLAYSFLLLFAGFHFVIQICRSLVSAFLYYCCLISTTENCSNKDFPNELWQFFFFF